MFARWSALLCVALVTCCVRNQSLLASINRQLTQFGFDGDILFSQSIPGKLKINKCVYACISQILSRLVFNFTLLALPLFGDLSPIIEHVEQVGIHPGKSCIAQVLNVTHHFEDGFETGKITGIVLVDLLAAYNTVNHRILLEKVYTMTRDYRLMCMIHTLLENGRLFVELEGKRSRWPAYRRGVSSHHFSSTYTQTTSLFTRARAVTKQGTYFAPIEETLTSALVGLSE